MSFSLSINQRTIRQWGLAELLPALRDRGIGGVGVWRDQIEELGLDRCAAMIEQAGVEVTSLCRGGFFTQRPRRDDDPGNLADNRRAIDEAAAIGAQALVLVCGGAPDGDTGEGEHRVRAALEELAPYAAERGVRLAIEPMHPMYCADRSVVVTIDQARRLAEPFPADLVGVALDTYHIWWDPDLASAVSRVADRLCVFQLADWVVPLGDPLLSRGLPGDGAIRFRPLVEHVRAAGFRGSAEVEIFNEELWQRPGDEALDLVCRAFEQHVIAQGAEA